MKCFVHKSFKWKFENEKDGYNYEEGENDEQEHREDRQEDGDEGQGRLGAVLGALKVKFGFCLLILF